MMDRGMVKWAPFNAVASGNYMVNEVLRRKSKVNMPILSDDQKYELQEKIFKFYTTQEELTIKYYKNGNFYLKKGKIINIDKNNHNIVITPDIKVFFTQIIEIY